VIAKNDKMKTIILIGGGHSHLEAIYRLGEGSLLNDCKLILISSETHTSYSGMIPGLISGHYTFEECHIDLQRLCNKYNCSFIQQSVSKILPTEQKILTESETYHYDLASINTGSIPNCTSATGIKEWAIPMKPLIGLAHKIEEFLADVGQSPKHTKHKISIVGGGAAGIEIALALQYQANGKGYNNLEYSLITAGNDILDTHSLAVRRKFHRILHQRGITTYYNATVNEVNKDSIKIESKRIIPSDFTILATGAAPTRWPTLSELPTTANGYITTDRFLQVKNISNLFAVGDVASIEGLTYPKSGVYAIKQAHVLATNINNKLRGMPLQAYRPQKNSLALISTGDKNAVASKNILCASGQLIWKWKNHIDQRFVKKFQ
tara:strand:- start:39711 stop:40847 length:1137 start_codon:yes stop_codon:yes gene_type:complete